jgi:hypothetical protein
LAFPITTTIVDDVTPAHGQMHADIHGLVNALQNVSPVPVILVAGNNTSADIKRVARYVCDGTADQTELNSAISDAATQVGGWVVPVGGFNVSGAVALQRSVTFGAWSHRACRIKAVGTWAGFDGAAQGGILEPADDHQDRVTVRGLTLWGDRTGGADTMGLYMKVAANTGFVFGDDSFWTIEDLYIYETKRDAVYGTGAYNRKNFIKNVQVFSCGTSGTTVAHGLNWDGNDSHFVGYDAGACSGNGIYVTGPNNRFTDSKAWYAKLNGWRLAGVRNEYAACEAQDNTQHGFSIENYHQTLAACLADSNSYDGSASPGTNRTYHGFYVWPFGGAVTLSACKALDKNEGGRGPRQSYGYYLDTGASQVQLHGQADDHFTGMVGGPGVNGNVNNIQINGSQGGVPGSLVRMVGSAMGSEVTFWRSEQTASLDGFGLNLPVATTALVGYGAGPQQSTRKHVDPLDIGSQVQLACTVRNVGGTAQTLTVSVCDAATPANVLATVSCALAAAVTTQTFLGTIAAKPGWFTAQATLAVFTAGGDGAKAYIFKDVTLRHRP